MIFVSHLKILWENFCSGYKKTGFTAGKRTGSRLKRELDRPVKRWTMADGMREKSLYYSRRRVIFSFRVKRGREDPAVTKVTGRSSGCCSSSGLKREKREMLLSQYHNFRSATEGSRRRSHCYECKRAIFDPRRIPVISAIISHLMHMRYAMGGMLLYS